MKRHGLTRPKLNKKLNTIMYSRWHDLNSRKRRCVANMKLSHLNFSYNLRRHSRSSSKSHNSIVLDMTLGLSLNTPLGPEIFMFIHLNNYMLIQCWCSC